MSEELKVTTAGDYKSKHQRTVKISSGEVFRVRDMNAHSSIAMLKLLPAKGATDITMQEFVMQHFDEIMEKVILPSVIEPKLSAEDYIISDVIELLAEIMNAGAVVGEEAKKVEEFRPEPDSPKS